MVTRVYRAWLPSSAQTSKETGSVRMQRQSHAKKKMQRRLIRLTCRKILPVVIVFARRPPHEDTVAQEHHARSPWPMGHHPSEVRAGPLSKARMIGSGEPHDCGRASNDDQCCLRVDPLEQGHCLSGVGGEERAAPAGSKRDPFLERLCPVCSEFSPLRTLTRPSVTSQHPQRYHENVHYGRRDRNPGSCFPRP